MSISEVEITTDCRYHCEEFSLTVCIGEDGVPVLYVDTGNIADDPDGPHCRIYLNDGILHETEESALPEMVNYYRNWSINDQ